MPTTGMRRRIVLTTESGTKLLLDFAEPMTLRDGDGLVLEDGSVVLVAGQAGSSSSRSARKAPLDFVRLAWHIGNRHTDVQIVGEGFRIRRDHVLEEMVRGSARVTMTPCRSAPFDPEARRLRRTGTGITTHDHELTSTLGQARSIA